ncbi:MAG: AI-2E family transporter [Eubacteriaceae bacterium]
MNGSPEKKRILLINLIVVLVIGVLAYLIWPTLAGMFSPFLFAIVLAYLLNPLVGIFEKRGLNRAVSVLVVFILVIAVVIGAFMSFIPSLINSIAGMINNIPNFINQLQSYSSDISQYVGEISKSQIAKYINFEAAISNFVKGFGAILQEMSNAIIQNSGQLMNLIIVPLVTAFLLIDKEFFVNGLMYLVPLKFRSNILKMCCDVDLVIGGFIKGQGLTSLIAGILTGAAAFFMGIPYASIIGLVAGITTMIPFFGPAIGTVIIVVLVLFTKPLMILPVLIAVGIIQVACGNFLAPALMSGNVGLHPVFIIFSIFFFGALFGGVGMIMAVPITGTIKVIAEYIIGAFASNDNESAIEIKKD